jgi:hypothetical protein
MTVQEMLDELQLKYPHAYTNTQVVNRFDRLQKRLFRYLNTLTYATTTTVNGTATYATTLDSRQIRKVTVDGIDYEYWTPEQDKLARYWYWQGGNINLFPTPNRSGLTIEIWGYKVPATLSVGSLAVTPDLESDYHMILVYGVAKEIAEDQRDGSMAVAMATAYNDYYTEMMQNYQNAESYVVKEIPWG